MSPLRPATDVTVSESGDLICVAENEDSPLSTTNSTEAIYAAFLWKFWESKRRATEP